MSEQGVYHDLIVYTFNGETIDIKKTKRTIENGNDVFYYNDDGVNNRVELRHSQIQETWVEFNRKNQCQSRSGRSQNNVLHRKNDSQSHDIVENGSCSSDPFVIETFSEIPDEKLNFLQQLILKFRDRIHLSDLIYDNSIYKLIRGDTQSGKSGLFWSIVWIQQNIFGVHPFVLTHNSKESQSAMTKKELSDFNRVLQDNGLPSLKVTDTLKNLEADVIPVILANSAQMAKLINYIQNSMENIIINCDEADLIFQDNNCTASSKKLQKKIEWILEKKIPMLMITATPYAVWLSKMLPRVKTFHFQPKASYRSLSNEKIKTHFVKEDCDMKNHEELFKIFTNIIVPYVTHLENNPLRYYAILYDMFPTKKSMDDYARFISEKRQTTAYVVYRKNLKECVQQFKNGKKTEISFSSIKEFFNYLEQENSKDFQHVIASEFASRANTFRPSREYGSGGLLAHINYCSQQTHMETFVQKQRMTGDYDALYPTQLQIMKKKDYYRLIREIENFNELCTMLYSNCHPRDEMEGKRLNLVGKHSRQAIDDTQYHQKKNQEYIEFETQEEFENFIATIGAHKIHGQFMNEIYQEIHLPSNFTYTNTRIRQYCPPLRNLHIASTTRRFEELNDIYHRFHTENYSSGRYTTGDITNKNKLFIIHWKDNFTNHQYTKDTKDLYDEKFSHDIYFPYYATNGKIRVYKNDGRKTGILTFC